MTLLGGFLPLLPARSESMMSRSKSRRVVLSPAEREMLRKLVRTGSPAAQQARRARILLELDENDPDRVGPVPTQEVIAERVGVHADTCRHGGEDREGLRRAWRRRGRDDQTV